MTQDLIHTIYLFLCQVLLTIRHWMSVKREGKRTKAATRRKEGK